MQDRWSQLMFSQTPKQALCTTLATTECRKSSTADGIRDKLSRIQHPSFAAQVGGAHSANDRDAELEIMATSTPYGSRTFLNHANIFHSGCPSVPQLTLDTADLCASDASLVSSPISPQSLNATYSDVEDQGYDTPFTSPESSPLKRQADRRSSHWQIDGAGSSLEDIAISRSVDEVILDPASVDDMGRKLDLPTGTTNLASLVVADPEADLDPDDEDSDNLIDLFPTMSVSDEARSSVTLSQSRPRTPTRRPSVLLPQCIRNPSPRQQSLRRKGIASPDRLVPSREITPTKEGLVTSIQPGAVAFICDNHDPFGTTTRRSIRTAEQYATLRGPAVPLRPAGVASTRVPSAPDTGSRSASTGTMWSVGGIAVTEGVLSTTDGRGGRVTSGTSAPHYSADFLRKRLPTDDEATHARRLALAMDLRSGNTMISPRPADVRPSRTSYDPRHEAIEHVTWRNGGWQAPALYLLARQYDESQPSHIES
ncbi:hypothetical protein LTR95_007364 [Oleoguttula sp. CCFEE 5521]